MIAANLLEFLDRQPDTTKEVGSRPCGVWAGTPFTIPGDWPQGVYVGTLVEGDGAGNPLQTVDPSVTFAPQGQLLLVCRTPTPGQGVEVLYKLPFFTWCAYNNVGPENHDPTDPNEINQNSVYTQPMDVKKVTFHRPGNGTGGTPWDARPYPDFFDGTSPRQTFAHWDAKFIQWLESNGFTVDYCTDLDIHEDAQLLSNYCLLLSVGHDEYWSQPMRDNIQAFVDGGGNIAEPGSDSCDNNAFATDCRNALDSSI